MKRIIFQVVLAAFIGLAAFSATSAQCNPNVESPIRCGYYNAGYQYGENDARANRSSNYRRYSNQYNRQYESAFRDGYQLGYSAASGGGGSGSYWNSSQRSAYDSGYSIGQSDRRQGGYGRNSARTGYDSSIALYFQQGYNDGFNNIGRRYDFPIGDPRPEPPPWGGGSNSAVWEGSVDDRANIIIRGSQITTQNVSGNGITTRRENVYGSLPRRNVTVQVNKREGRGDVRVIQQPSRANNFAAVIQVYDSRGGRDNYGIEVTWTGGGWGNVEEPYSSGTVQWRGRVDQTVDIIISGDYVDSRDVAGTGMIVTSSRLTGYLAQRPGRVTATRRNGRGQVQVIQQPSRNNDYTAIVRISDTDGGADNYSVDIRW